MGSEEARRRGGARPNMAVETDGALHGGVTTFAHFVGQRTSPPAELARRFAKATVVARRYFLPRDHERRGHLPSSRKSTGSGSVVQALFTRTRRGHGGLTWLGGRRTADAVRSLGLRAPGGAAIVIVHAEDIELIAGSRTSCARRAGATSPRGARRDERRGGDARASGIELAQAAGAPVYIAHLSTAEAADLVAAARGDGRPVWAEVTPHHLTHTGDWRRRSLLGEGEPAAGARTDCERLWRAFHDGGVTCLGSDHGTGGRTRATKQGGGDKHGNIWAARSGNRGGLEHFLPVMLTFGVHAGRISIEDLARIGATNPAKVFGLSRKGALIPGADADIVWSIPSASPCRRSLLSCLCE